jgi:hypothetical protein
VACAWLHLGEKGKALDHLERIDFAAMANRAWMDEDPYWNTIRSEPRFQALMAQAR